MNIKLRKLHLADRAVFIVAGLALLDVVGPDIYAIYYAIQAYDLVESIYIISSSYPSYPGVVLIINGLFLSSRAKKAKRPMGLIYIDFDEIRKGVNKFLRKLFKI